MSDTDTTLTTFGKTPSLLTAMEVISDKAVQGDFAGLVDIGHVLISQGQMRGKLLASLLYQINLHWITLSEVGGIQDTFEKWSQAEFTLSAQTITKYTSMWTRLFGADSEVPESLRPQLLEAPTENLILVAPLAEDKPTKAEWKKIAAAAGDKDKLRALIQEKRGKKTSAASALRLTIDKDGRITALRGKEKPVVVGLLKVNGKDQLQQDAIERILRLAGIVRK